MRMKVLANMLSWRHGSFRTKSCCLVVGLLSSLGKEVEARHHFQNIAILYEWSSPLVLQLGASEPLFQFNFLGAWWSQLQRVLCTTLCIALSETWTEVPVISPFAFGPQVQPASRLEAAEIAFLWHAKLWGVTWLEMGNLAKEAKILSFALVLAERAAVA